jgi:hypothetical protein
MAWLIMKITYQFSPKSGIVFFVGVFVPLTRSKNYEILRVVIGLRDERPIFSIEQNGVCLTLFPVFQSLRSVYQIETINVFFFFNQ